MRLPSILHTEPHGGASSAQLNWLRAAVLGADDGIVSLSALLVGVAGATDSLSHILITGVAGLLAGALSMAVGEYVSVSSQRDTELALIAKEKNELATMPEEELEELTRLYQQKGLLRGTAEQVAKELTAHDAFAAHAEAELRIDPDELTNPWQAAFASAISFTAGAIIPILAITLSPGLYRIEATFVAVFIALVITGILSARTSGASVASVTLRVVLGGIFAMVVTFGIGRLFGIATG
ncbi:MAG: VIT family protein [Candidatus Pacebacteria bacterium]|nr:VIT family protein [Candidatus Paceibacterota bacterium]